MHSARPTASARRPQFRVVPAAPALARRCAVLLSLVALHLPVPVTGQGSVTYRIDRWTTEDGLPSHTINDAVQTPDGYLWLATTGGLVRFDGLRFEAFPGDPPAGLPSNRITGLAVGRGDTLWIATEDGYLLHRSDGRFTVLAGPGDALIDVEQDATGAVWVSKSPGLWKYAAGQLIEVQGIDLLYMARDFAPVGPQLVRDGGDTIWLRDDAAGRMYQLRGDVLVPAGDAAERVLLLEPSRRRVLRTRDGPRGVREVVDADGRRLAAFTASPDALPRLLDRTGRLWITRDGAIEAYSPGSIAPVARLELPPGAAVGVMIEDREGNLWATTGGSGLLRVQALPFRVYGQADGIRERQVLSIARGAQGSVLVTDRRWNVYRVSTHGVETVFEARHGADRGDHAWGAYEDQRGTLWLGRLRESPDAPARYFVEGRRRGAETIIFDLPTGYQMVHRFLDDPIGDGVLWILDRRTWRFRPYADPPTLEGVLGPPGGLHTRDLLVDPDGTLWVATHTGLYRVRDGVSTVFRTADGLPVDRIRALHRDGDGVLWIGTYGGGIVRYADGRFRTVRAADGLAEDVVSTILEDDSGDFWMSGNQGVHRVARSELNALLDGRATRVRGIMYGRRAGITNPEASGWHAFRGEDGRLWFPTFDGAATVHPAFARSLERDPPLVHVEALRVGNRSHAADGPVRLAAGERRFEIVYTGISLRDPDAVRFQYRLDGLDPDWIEAGAERKATYTNVPPGHFTFRVRARTDAGTWSEAAAPLPLVVAPLFYQTPWFYLLVAATLSSLGVAASRLRVRKLRLREQQLRHLVREQTQALADEKERAERALATVAVQAERLRSIDEAKSRFFTNVSHELRTPLTLVLGPLDDVIEERTGPIASAVRGRLEIARRNGHRTVQLVDRLLDIARLEAGTLRLDVSDGDATAFLHDVARSFVPLAEREGVAFHIRLPTEPVRLRFDPDELEKVVANLLANAFKFTGAGGTIELRARRERATGSYEGVGLLLIQVADNGPGIGPDHLSCVFERFYQADDSADGGLGVGLALVRELVELHGGSVHVESREGAGATFTISLPLAPEPAAGPALDPPCAADAEAPLLSPTARDPRSPPGAPARSASIDSVEPLRPTEALLSAARPEPDALVVLLVEDNDEVRTYLREHLAVRYRVVEAANGRDGLRLARALVPDLVLSDVMMAETDGEAMCRELKADPETDFIPVLLLTARASLEARLTALEGGADDYVTKPFDMRELLARVANAIDSRRRLHDRLVRERNGRSVPVPPEDVADAKDRALLERVYAVLDRNLDDEDFGPERLAAALAMSRATLYRRLRRIVDVPPMELIWRYRLEQAEIWLRDGAANVAAVAYAVGFKSVAHFSERFRERYGTPPSRYRASAGPGPLG
jgi:signal transduction histidine kinase/ligand-binding sensor domain-containing protein/DNA-binding response OmpR family regulator